MKRLRIPIFDRFDTTSHIIPYYAHTHTAFLLLSALCSNSRGKLDEYYDEFIMHMEGHRICIDMYLESIQNWLFLPCDLFIIDITSINKSNFDEFVLFIENLAESKGWFFNSHFLYSKIKIKDLISVDSSSVEKLHNFIDVLKSIHVNIPHKFDGTITLDTIGSYILIIKKSELFYLNYLAFIKQIKYKLIYFVVN